MLFIVGCGTLCFLLVFIVTLAAQTRRLQQSESQLRDLSGRLINVQDDERKRIARELHDDFGQRIALIKIDLERLAREQQPTLRNPTGPGLRDVIARTDEFASDLQHLSHTLHSSRLQYVGIRARLRMLGGRLLVQSIPGRGTTLTALVPHASDQPCDGATVAQGQCSDSGRELQFEHHAR